MSLVSRHPTAARYTAALLFFSAVTAVWFHNLVLHPESRIACCIGDGTSFLRDYFTASAQHQNMLSFTHDSYNGAPEGTDRPPAALIANAGLQTLVVSVLRGPIGLVPAWNLYALLGLLGTGMAVFWLLRRLGCTTVSALFGGYVVAFSPYALERLYAGHLSLMQNWVFVLVIAAMLGLRERRTYGRASVVGATIGLAFYVSAYEGLFAAVTALTFLVVELWRLPERRERIRSLALISLTYGAAALTLLPLAYAYSRERSTLSLTVGHTTSDFYFFAARMSSYLVPSPRNPLAHFARSLHTANLTEQTLFFGYSTMLLALVGVVLLFRRNAWLRSSPTRWWSSISIAVLIPVAFALSLPPVYHAGSIPILTPSAVLAASTSFWRVFSRFGMLAGFAVALLAALALTALARRPGRVWRLLPPLALVVAVLELLPGNAGTFDVNARPGWVAWLASAPRGIVAAYPMDYKLGPSLYLSGEQFWYQALDHDPSFEISGQSYFQTVSRQQAIRFIALDLSRPITARVLATEGVRYAVVDDAAYTEDGRKPPVVDPRHFTLLARRGKFRIYSVHAPRVNLDAALHAREREIATLGGLTPQHVVQTGDRVRIQNSTAATQMLLFMHAVNERGPRLLRLRDSAGHVVASSEARPGESTVRLGPFRVPVGGDITLSLSGTGSGLVLSGPSLRSLPAYIPEPKSD